MKKQHSINTKRAARQSAPRSTKPEMSYSDFEANLTRISTYEQITYTLKKRLLNECGWICRNNGSTNFSMWKKQVGDKVFFANDINAALALQDGFSSQKAEAK